MAVNGRNADALLKMGIEGGSSAFDSAYKQAAGAQEAAAADQRNRALQEFLLGKKQEQATAEAARDLEQAQALRQQYGKDSPVRVGSVSIGGDDQSANLMRQMQMNMAMDDKVENATTAMGNRIEKEGIPAAANAMQDIARALPGEGEELKSYGGPLGLKALIPDGLVRVGESMGLLAKGAGEERAAMEAAKGLVRNPLYGASLSENERKSFDSAYGGGLGTTSDQVRKATQRMAGVPISALQNIEQSTRPQAAQRYQGRGGLTSDKLRSFLTPKPAVAAPAAMDDGLDSLSDDELMQRFNARKGR